MSNWSQDYTVKSNARRGARKAGIDAAKVVAFVKAGKTLYRFPLAATARSAPDFQDSTKTGGKGKWKSKAQKKREAKTAKPAKAASKPKKPASNPKPSTGAGGGKFDQVAAMLRRPGGASMTEVVAVTGWKPHSARARISVDVSKLLGKGEVIERRRENSVSHYAIVKSKQLELPDIDKDAA